MNEQLLPQTDLKTLQENITKLQIENQRLSAAVLLLEQLFSAFAVDLNPEDRAALIRNIDNNFHELGAADTIPTSPTPSRSSTALNVARKLHQLSSITEMFPHTKD